MTWNPDIVPKERRLGLLSWALVLVRGLAILVVIYSLLFILFLVRLLEAPFGRRLVSPAIVQLACRMSLFILCLKVTTKGRPMTHKGAVVSNHASWLDIFALNAPQKVYFVSKSEVSNWPVIGFIARSAGTVFIQRKSADAARQKTQFEARLDRGDRLHFFPEGTSTDTRRVLKFKSSLFAAFFEPRLVNDMWIQPATINYRAPKGEDPRFYGWWGDMYFAPHFFKTLGAVRSGAITVTFHDPVRVQDFENRKALAAYCEEKARGGLRLD